MLNNSFPTKEFRHRFRVTNNGQNRTFWPSWIGLYDDEDMDFALTVLRIFRKAYEQYFDGTLKECRRLTPISYRHVETAFTETAFANLAEAFGKAYGRENADAAKPCSADSYLPVPVWVFWSRTCHTTTHCAMSVIRICG